MGKKVNPRGIRLAIPSPALETANTSSAQELFQGKDFYQLRANLQKGAYTKDLHHFQLMEDFLVTYVERCGFLVNRCRMEENFEKIQIFMDLFHRSRTCEPFHFQRDGKSLMEGDQKKSVSLKGVNMRRPSWTVRKQISWHQPHQMDWLLLQQLLETYMSQGLPLRMQARLLEASWAKEEGLELEKSLQFSRKTPYFEDGLRILSIIGKEPAAPLLAKYISLELKDVRRRQTSFLNFLFEGIEELMKSKNLPLKGCLIRVKGRVDGAARSKKEEFRQGSVPLHTLEAAIDYAYQPVITKHGISSVKVWLAYHS